MTEFKLPELGENIESAEVIRLLVSEGDVIEADQNVMELESEKAAVSLPCPIAGQITKVHVQEGDAITIGQTLLSVDEKKEASALSTNGERQPTDGEDGPADREATPSAKEAAVTELADATTVAATPPKLERADKKPQSDGQQRPSSPVAAGPATRRLARELGVDLRDVTGSGRRGLITREDVKAHVKQSLQSGHIAGGSSMQTPALPNFEQWGSTTRQRLSKLARTSAERLSRTWQLVPHVTQHDLVDITELEAARKRYNAGHPNAPAKITLTAIAIKAVVPALRSFPTVNSTFDAQSGEIIFKEYCHIGVAVDTEHGLLVPVLRDADKKSLVQIAAELTELADKARKRELTIEDLQGGTFTITNVGGIAGTYFTPIINYPEVAILGMSRSFVQPVSERLMLPLSLSYDHRVINGADGARFIRYLGELLGDPFTLSAEA